MLLVLLPYPVGLSLLTGAQQRTEGHGVSGHLAEQQRQHGEGIEGEGEEVVSCDYQVNMTKTKKRQSAPDREKEIQL
uniref:Secreted protein n=1 Tax=Oryza glumipatula TaxID=40148 RepID=A0A0D9YD63_9ORYZ